MTLALAVALCLLIVVVRVQQYAFRFRAERLENDMRSLQYGRTTFAQAQPIFQRWNARYDDGTCEAVKCSAEITIGDFAYHFQSHQKLFRTYGILGGRPAAVSARVSLRNGVVSGKSYVIYIEVFPSEAVAAGFTPYGYSLIGETATMESLASEQWNYSLSSTHPTYRIGSPSGCEICIMIHAHFTAAASSTDVQRLGQIDFSCLTRWLHSCKLKGDIMPAAWQDIHQEHPEMTPY